MARRYAGSGGERAVDIRMAVEAERERCAKIADNHAEDTGDLEGGDIYIARKIAEAIRAQSGCG